MVLAVATEILCTVWGVPGISAGGPGQGVGEGVEEIVESPHQDHDVVRVTEEHYHHRRQAQT